MKPKVIIYVESGGIHVRATVDMEVSIVDLDSDHDELKRSPHRILSEDEFAQELAAYETEQFKEDVQ